VTTSVHTRPDDARPRRPGMTVAVLAVTLATGVAAQLSPALSAASTRDLPRLRAGEWWRIVTPVLVQPSGWGQLVFNLLGLVVVGIALQRHLGPWTWLSIYVVGGVGSIVVVGVWDPSDTGGGSSAAVAALIGSLAVLRLSAGADGSRIAWWAQLYSVFFVVYLTAMAAGGVLPAVIAGNTAIVLAVVAHRAWRPTTLARGCAGVVIVGAVTMVALEDDHGVGLGVGVVAAALVLAHRRFGAPNSAALRLLVDLVVPVALFYGLLAAGVDLVVALVVGAAVPAASAIVTAVTTRRIEGLAIAVIALLLLSSAVSLVTGSPRFLLAKDAGLTAVWGAWFILSLRGRRPLTFRFTRPLVEGRTIFGRTAVDAWDQLWETDAHFRRMWQVSSVIWGTALVLDAAVRVVIAYTLPLDVVPGLAGALWPVTFVALQVVTNIYFARCGLWATPTNW